MKFLLLGVDEAQNSLRRNTLFAKSPEARTPAVRSPDSSSSDVPQAGGAERTLQLFRWASGSMVLSFYPASTPQQPTSASYSLLEVA
jgi:hypothetical protein